MLELSNPTKYTHTTGDITIDLSEVDLTGMLNHIRNMIHTFSKVSVMIDLEAGGFLQYGFENGRLVQQPEEGESDKVVEINRVLSINQYIDKVQFQKRIKVNCHAISPQDQFHHIKQLMDAQEEPIFVSFNSGTVHNRRPWHQAFEVKPTEVQGFISGVDITDEGLYCTVEFNVSQTVREIIHTTPPILIGLYGMIDGRCVKLIRMFVRPMYTHEIAALSGKTS